MKKLALITATFVICHFNSHSQEKDPLYMPWMLSASLGEHKDLWKEIGFNLLETNYDKCILIYDDPDAGIRSFVDFSNGWKYVEEVVIASESPETYNMYYEFCAEQYQKSISKKNEEVFTSPGGDANIIFLTKKLSDGFFYIIRIKPIN